MGPDGRERDCLRLHTGRKLEKENKCHSIQHCSTYYFLVATPGHSSPLRPPLLIHLLQHHPHTRHISKAIDVNHFLPPRSPLLPPHWAGTLGFRIETLTACGEKL